MIGRIFHSVGPGVLSGFKHGEILAQVSLWANCLPSLLQFLHFQNGVDDPTYQIGLLGI